MQDRNDLNEAQKKAVLHVEGPLLVLAGAGSGKTRVVTYRIAHLLQIGVPASDILALTFTNKAAEEMRKRVRELTHQFPLTTTFHSLGARILRDSIHHLGYSRSFVIYDDKDSEKLLKSCLETLAIKEEKETVRLASSWISEQKNELVPPEKVVALPGDSRGTLLKNIYTLYQARLKEYNALDFDDLLFLTVELFRIPEMAREYQEKWRFVLVDEYQDTNKAQYLICRALTEKSKNLFVVGDPDQSIYSWRGANIQNILNFEKDFPGAKVIALEENYRSTNCFLSAANALIQNNPRPYQKNLFSKLGEGEKIHLHTFQNDREEAYFVVSQVEKYLKQYKPYEMVIFYRTNAQSRIFEDAFLKAQIPYVIVGGLSFYQRKEIKDVLSFLRLVVAPADFISFQRTINLPKRGFGDVALARLGALVQEKALPVLDVCKKIIQGEIAFKLSTTQRENLEKYLSIFSTLEHKMKGGTPIHELITTLIQLSFYNKVLEEDPETVLDRKENIDALIAKAIEWQLEALDPTLSRFIEELSLKASLDEAGDKLEAVKLMTIHNGKGLEFTVTFIVGLEEDLFPHLNARDSEGGIDEERRLCYVGITRAKRHLHLSCAACRFLWGAFKVMRPSRFLKEIPANHFASFEGEEEETCDEEPKEGSLVLHKDFGKGIVKRVYNTSFGLTYDVEFLKDHSKKTLVAAYAKLKLLTTEPVI